MAGLFIVLFALYFVPWIIAASRNHHNRSSIAILNLFLGWTFIGWLIALIWSASSVTPVNAGNTVAPTTTPKSSSFADELLKLADLRDKGILTQEEFDAKKAVILERV